MPRPLLAGDAWASLAAFLIGLVGRIVFAAGAKAQQAATGKQSPVGLVALGAVVGLPVLVLVVARLSPATARLSAGEGPFNLRGGMQIPPEFVALLLGLALYTAGFIAEVVRAGILAVSKGQTEAAGSLGLRPGQTLRLVVIPQAMRVIIPPLTSQYLNLTKNSSLAVAIGYPGPRAGLHGHAC